MQMRPPLLSAAVAVADCAAGALRKLKRRRTHITLCGLVQVTVMEAAKGTLLADPRLLVFLAANKG